MHGSEAPTSITTPDTIEARLGTLRFSDGLLDEVPLSSATTISILLAPWSRSYAMREGYGEAGVTDNGATRLFETQALLRLYEPFGPLVRQGPEAGRFRAFRLTRISPREVERTR